MSALQRHSDAVFPRMRGFQVALVKLVQVYRCEVHAMNAQRAFVSMLLFAAAVGLVFLSLAIGQGVKLGGIAAVVRHPLLGLGAAAVTTAALGAMLLL